MIQFFISQSPEIVPVELNEFYAAGFVGELPFAGAVGGNIGAGCGNYPAAVPAEMDV